MNSIKQNVKTIKDAGLQLTGVSYKVMKEGILTEERLSMINNLTDVVIERADNILSEAETMEVLLEDRGKTIGSLKKDLSKYKRKLEETTVEKGSLEGEYKKAKEEKDQLQEECEKVKIELNDSKRSLHALGFEDEILSNPISPVTRTPPSN